MADRRSYAGPHEATDVQIAGGIFATILRSDIGDELVERYGYTLDSNADPADGLIFAHRSVVVSDHLAAAMPVEVFPRVGGEVSDDDAIDDPASNPVTSLAVALADAGEPPAPSVREVFERQRDERVAELDAELARLDADAAKRDEAAAAIRDRLDNGITVPGEDEDSGEGRTVAVDRPLNDDERAEDEAQLQTFDNDAARDAKRRGELDAQKAALLNG